MFDKDRFHSVYSLFLALFLSLVAISALSLNYAESAEGIGNFRSIEGSVDSLRDGKLPAVPAKVGNPVFEKDVIRTKSASKAEIGFKDGNTLRIGQRSRINISEYLSGDRNSREIIQLQRGKVEAIVDKNNAKRIAMAKDAHFFEIRTPNAVAGVRGTNFFVSSDMNVTVVLVKYGNVCVNNAKIPEKVVCLPPGYITTVTGESPPTEMRPATDADFKWFEVDISSEFNPSPSGGTNSNVGVTGPTDVITTETPHTMRDVPLSIPYSVTNPETLTTAPTPTPPTPTPPTPTPPTPTPPTPTPPTPTPPTPTPPTPTPPTPTPPTPTPPTPTPPTPTPPTLTPPTSPGGGGDLAPLNPPKPRPDTVK